MTDLHIPNLTIDNFRGIDHLEIPHLGRVTLLVGKNSIGKTTVLDALRTYAARGEATALWDILYARDELRVEVDDDGDPRLAPDLPALFFDRDQNQGITISSNFVGRPDPLYINWITASSAQSELHDDDSPSISGLQVSYGGESRALPWIGSAFIGGLVHRRIRYPRQTRLSAQRGEDTWPFPQLTSESLGPDIPDNDDLGRYWDAVALTPNEHIAREALGLVFRSQIAGVAVLGDGGQRLDGPRFAGPRRPVVRLEDRDDRLPLRRLGEGAVRLYGLALALANSKNGLLFIDEIENGIHYGIQPDMWNMVFRIAEQNNVQVVATTHGWDCLWGFARAAIDNGHNRYAVLNLRRIQGVLRVTEFSGSDLEEIAEQRLEPR